LRRLIDRGLAATARLWPGIARAYAWVHAAARLLGNPAGEDAGTVRRRFDGLLGAMARHAERAGPLRAAIDRFRKVARSYRPGLFHCHAVPGLPGTNNDLEQLFGAARYHERRATGRKAASPAAVLRGPVRLIAATATRTRPPTARDLGRADRRTWMELRRRLDGRRRARIQRCRFRRDPDAYLASLERLARQSALPA
jgi:hypothetical protein